jgi:hypothetical protein
MKITKDIHGWLIEPDTSEEEKALVFVFQAFEKKYCVCEETHSKDVRKANLKSSVSPVQHNQTLEV